MASRRSFLKSAGVTAGAALVPLAAPVSCRRPAPCLAAVDRGAAVDAVEGDADHQHRAAAADRAGAPVDGRQRAGRHRDDGRHLARLLQQHPLVEQRAPVPDDPARQGRAVLRVPRIRGGPRTRADLGGAAGRRRRRAHVAGGRRPLRPRGRRPEGPRHRDRPPGRSKRRPTSTSRTAWRRWRRR